MTAPPARLASWTFAAVLLAVALRYAGNREEDFVYYYCAGSVAAQGRSAYDPGPYQACIEARLGRENQNNSKGTGFPYAPSALLPFGALARLPYHAAFLAWSLVAGLASFWAWRELLQGCPGWGAGGAWVGLLLLSSPGFLLSWGYHKLALVLFPVLLWGVRRLDSGDDAPGAAALALLAFKPQLFLGACLHLLARRRWRALAVAAACAAALQLPFAASHGPAAWAQWCASLLRHAESVFSLDNQSLFACLYKPLRHAVPGPTDALQALRYGTSAALLLWALRPRPGLGLRASLPAHWGAYLLALPYSTGADSLWAFPLLLEGLERLRLRTGLPPWTVASAGLAAQLLCALALGGYAPAHLARDEFQYREGYLTLLIALFRGFLYHLRP